MTEIYSFNMGRFLAIKLSRAMVRSTSSLIRAKRGLQIVEVKSIRGGPPDGNGLALGILLAGREG